MFNHRLAALFTQLRGVVGDDHVQRFDANDECAGEATFASDVQVLGAVQPANALEVAAVVRACQRHQVPFYAISTGRNWGYGSALPATNGLRIELARMTRIVEFNDQLGYVRVEPGVTSAQLYAFLQAQGGRFWMDATGSSPDCSVVGNTLERGFGHTPYANHSAHGCALEVVLADGSVIDTGLGAMGHAAARNVYPQGLGPDVSGLFTQSSLGIVTAMTIWLMPAPETFCAFFFSVKDANSYPEVIEALRPLRVSGLLQSAVHIGNAYRVLPSFTQCPSAVMDAGGALDGSAFEDLKRRFDVSDWHGSGAFYGTPARVREAKQRLRAALKGKVGRLIFIDDRRLALLQKLRPVLKRIGAHRFERQLNVLQPAYDLLKGVPTSRFLGSAYWRKRQAVPAMADLDRDRCGLIWCSVLSEISGAQAHAVQAIATTCLLDAGFEPGLTTTFLSERCLDHVISISYDRDVSGADAKAQRAFETLLDALMAQGYYPYRLPTFAQRLLAQATPEYRAVLSRIEHAFDANRLLARGRYTFSEPQPVRSMRTGIRHLPAVFSSTARATKINPAVINNVDPSTDRVPAGVSATAA